MVGRQRLVDLVVEVRVVRLRRSGSRSPRAGSRRRPSAPTASGPDEAVELDRALAAQLGPALLDERSVERVALEIDDLGDHGRCGTGAGWSAAFSARNALRRIPSCTGMSPPSSSRASSTRPRVRTVRNPKSREEVGREDRPVDEEPLVHGLPLGVAVGERLERLRAAVLRVADRRQEERLHHPRRRRVDDVRAGDEHRLRRRRPGRAARRRAGRARTARTASSRGASRRRRSRPCPTRPTPPRPSGSSAACRSGGAATATTCTRGRRTERSRALRRSGRRRAAASDAASS